MRKSQQQRAQVRKKSSHIPLMFGGFDDQSGRIDDETMQQGLSELAKINTPCFVYDPKWLAQTPDRSEYNRLMDRRMNETIVILSDDPEQVDLSVFTPLFDSILAKKK